MNSIVYWLKNLFNRKGVFILIFINLSLYIIIKFIEFITFVFNANKFLHTLLYYFNFSVYYLYTFFKPWSILTYSFINDSLISLIFCIVTINIFGKILEIYLSKKYLFICYIFGSIVAAILLSL